MNELKKFASWVLCAFAFVALIGTASCGSDGDDGPDDPTPSEKPIVNITQLSGEWTLVKNVVYWSKEDSGRDDEIIDYSGNTFPYYKYYTVTVDKEKDMMTWQEVSTNGSAISDKINLYLDGNKIYDEENDLVGKVIAYDPSHSWNNLQILWEDEEGPVYFNASSLSTYMKIL